MAQRLRALAILQRTWSSVPSTHMTTHHLQFQGTNTLWPWTPEHARMYTHTGTPT